MYVALLQLIDLKGLPGDGWLSFSLYEVVELMGRSHSGRDYMQVRDSLQRMATTTVESNNAFYHRGRKEYISDTFSLLSEVKLSEYEERDGGRSDRNRMLLSRYFVGLLQGQLSQRYRPGTLLVALQSGRQAPLSAHRQEEKRQKELGGRDLLPPGQDTA